MKHVVTKTTSQNTFKNQLFYELSKRKEKDFKVEIF